jgi:hypothetical protein
MPDRRALLVSDKAPTGSAEVGTVPIRLLLANDHSFGPDDTAVLDTAFESALSALGLADREDPATAMVAKTFIELAKGGERDPARLRDGAIKLLSR